MTTNQIFSRPFAALSVFFALAIGVGLIAAPSTARAEAGTGSVVFSVFMDDDSDDAGFMDYTDDAGLSSSMTRQTGDVSPRALRDTAATSPAGPIAAPSTPAQGIIMRDGGICDPIRHMGC